MIAALEVPDFQAILAEDIRQSALGHLGGGLLEAHALDEGGSETGVIGAHDEMWYMVRDLAMGEDKYPLPAPPKSLHVGA